MGDRKYRNKSMARHPFFLKIIGFGLDNARSVAHNCRTHIHSKQNECQGVTSKGEADTAVRAYGHSQLSFREKKNVQAEAHQATIKTGSQQ